MPLFNGRCPTHVPRFIVTIGILAVYGVPVTRAWADVQVKGEEVRLPPRSDTDSLTPVQVVPVVLGIVAASPHVQPRTVLRGVQHPVRKVVFHQSPMRAATAGRRGTASHVLAAYQAFRPARATAVPSVYSVTCVGRSSRHDSPVGKPITGCVNEPLAHAVVYTVTRWLIRDENA